MHRGAFGLGLFVKRKSTQDALPLCYKASNTPWQPFLRRKRLPFVPKPQKSKIPGLATSLSSGKKGEGKTRERLVILGMLINIHELPSLASIFKRTGLLLTVSSKLESAIVKEHHRESLSVVSLCFLSI